jgi:hypothetical protein
VIGNDGSLDTLRREVGELWRRLAGQRSAT